MRKLFLTIFIILIYIKVVCAQEYDSSRISPKEIRCLDYSTQYYVAKSQINSAFQEKKYLENLKKNYSVLDKNGSIQRSRLQALINAKDNETFRLKRRQDYISTYQMGR
jgi:hypothetical protein